jgi:hypothetical protein
LQGIKSLKTKNKMSQVKNDFFALLSPHLESDGYKYLKAQNAFRKDVEDISYKISIKFDGRGGLVMIDWIDFTITGIKDKKKPNGVNDNLFLTNQIHYYQGSNIPFIPVMYSKQALDVANDMNLRKLAAIPYEEKYPRVKIENCVHKVLELYRTTITDFFNDFDLSQKE